MTFHFKIPKKPVTAVNQLRKSFVLKIYISVHVLIFKLFFCLSPTVVSIPDNYAGPLICLFNDYDLSSANDPIATHSSLERLEYLIDSSTMLKSLYSTWLKYTSKLGWPWGGFQEDLGENAGISLKFSEISFRKYHFILTHLYRILLSLFSILAHSPSCEIAQNLAPFLKLWFHFWIKLCHLNWRQCLSRNNL